jgi:murein DD-endopeptidase MepM/ murein hydrolase activator NlpD
MKLILKNPVQPVSVNQPFGDPNNIYKKQGLLGHNGIDFMAKHGQPIYASHDGLASFQIDGGGGHGVVVITDKEYDYEDGTAYFKTIYWHMCDGLKEPQYQSPIADKTGFIPIKTGDLIGYADNTGASTGDHLHFGLKPVAKGEDWGTWYNVSQNNGYNGAIDPAPYFENADTQKEVDLAKKLIDTIPYTPATNEQKWQWLEVIKNFLKSL